MRHYIDDEIYRVRMIWLGPAGVATFPWNVRYASYALAAGILGVLLWIENAAGTLHGWPVLETAVAIGVTHLLMRTVTHERPLTAAVRIIAATAATSVTRWLRNHQRPTRSQTRVAAAVTRTTEDTPS